MNEVNIAVIGCGVIGRVHMDAVSRNARAKLVAVVDVRADLAQELAEKHGTSRWYTTAAEAIADDNVHAVILALPTHLRYELGLEVLRGGKHLLTEKPAAMNGDEVRGLLKAQTQSGKVAASCSSRYSLLPHARAAQSFLATGALGPLRVLSVRAPMPPGPPPASVPPVWRLRRDLNGGGILVNWGVYDLDFILGLVDWQVLPVEAFAVQFSMPPALADRHQAPGSDAETHIVGMVTFSNGAVLQFERGERVPLDMPATWQVQGDNGALRIDMLTPRKPVLHDELRPDSGMAQHVIFHDAEANEDSHHPGPQADFVDAILDKRPPQTDLRKSLMMMAIIDALYESASTGKSAPVQME